MCMEHVQRGCFPVTVSPQETDGKACQNQILEGIPCYASTRGLDPASSIQQKFVMMEIYFPLSNMVATNLIWLIST